MIVGARKTQPYRARRGRQPGPVLDAMLRGRAAFMANPMDVQRKTVKRSRRRRRARIKF